MSSNRLRKMQYKRSAISKIRYQLNKLTELILRSRTMDCAVRYEKELAFSYIDETTSHIEMNQTGEITHTYVSLANVCRVPYLTTTGAISIRNGAI